MYSKLQQRLQKLSSSTNRLPFTGSLIGVEKESLRVNCEGKISQTSHPDCLGSPLTHPSITTDYAEALVEFVTPPLASIPEVTHYLRDAQQFTYNCLDNEYFWSTSMPCVISGESSIRIAEYGSSNAGKMKHVYRRGLGYRYGKVMQVIAGVHFNYSVPENFWPQYASIEGKPESDQTFINTAYMGLIRNLQRYGWLVIYLFGASPAVCKTFLSGLTNQLSELDFGTFYLPYATSLRMGDIGYQNNKENEHGIKANYNSLEEYTAGLLKAVKTPCKDYEKLGVMIDGEYRQLNANILQIENEYYSTVRPKQILQGMEMPSLALNKRGIQYVELRSIDVNAYDPLGINDQQLYFLELLVVFCLLQDSPLINETERSEIDQNELLAAHQGREPGLLLDRNSEKLTLKDWGLELCEQMLPLCKLLDDEQQYYSKALAAQKEKLLDSETTPSAQILNELQNNRETFFKFAERLSKNHRRYFLDLPTDEARQAIFLQAAEQSRAKQQAIEASDNLSFEAYLKEYFSQR